MIPQIQPMNNLLSTTDRQDPAHIQAADNELERAIGSQVKRYRKEMELTVYHWSFPTELKSLLEEDS